MCFLSVDSCERSGRKVHHTCWQFKDLLNHTPLPSSYTHAVIGLGGRTLMQARQ